MLKKMDFIKPATMRVLETFFSNPLEKLHEREVVRRAGVSSGSANRILRQLSSLGFLIREGKGRMVFYELNIRDPTVRQFKVLYNVWSLREFVGKVSQVSRRVVLFGSCSAGTDVKESDIDLLIITREKAAVREVVDEFNRRHARRVSPIIKDSGEFSMIRKEDEPLYERIERGITLWEMEQET